MNLLDEQYREFVQPTTLTKKLTLNGETKAYPIYRVRLELLYYNEQNDRIATWISQYKSEHGGFQDLSQEAYNAVIEDFIIKSNPASIEKTKNNIKAVNQREPGVILSDGRIVDGNRRFTCLRKLAEEDPTFRVETNPETGETVISGMGELHLEIIVDRLLREFKVEANVGAPQVAYKETITKAVDVDSKYAKQSGGRGQYGHCKVKFEPMDANGEELYKFESTVVGGAIPKEYIPAVGEGIEEAMKAGILGGFPVVGVYANVYDGSYHEVDSSEMAFHIAGSLAFKDAMQKAAPVLLEPIMKVEVTTPEDYMGDVIGDINSRRGRIEGMEDIGGGKMIRGYVPLSEMFGYATDLRSRTQGRGNYSMFFEKYEQCPKNIQEKVLANKNS